jgi:hypothetical protein
LVRLLTMTPFARVLHGRETKIFHEDSTRLRYQGSSVVADSVIVDSLVVDSLVVDSLVVDSLIVDSLVHDWLSSAMAELKIWCGFSGYSVMQNADGILVPG